VALDELQQRILGHRNRHAGVDKFERIDRLGGDRLSDFEVSCG
jgi:hypothetical protein